MDIKRKMFLDKNQCWIDFLNDYASGRLEKLNEVTLREKLLDVTVRENIINMLVKSQDLKDLEKVCSRIADNDKEFMIILAGWMYENLKACSRGQRELIYSNRVDFFLIEVMLNKIKVSLINETGYDYDLSIESYMSDLRKYLHLFLDYRKHVLHGLKELARFGVYKIGVCPYHRKGKPECGKVFVGAQWNSEACEEHSKKWKAMKIRIKK